MDADDLLHGASPAEQHPIDLRFPLPEPGAGSSADVATFVTVGAHVRAQPHRLDGLVVLVAEDVEWTDDHTGGTPRAQPGDNDLVVEIPPLSLVGGGGHMAASIGGPTSRKAAQKGLSLCYAPAVPVSAPVTPHA